MLRRILGELGVVATLALGTALLARTLVSRALAVAPRSRIALRSPDAPAGGTPAIPSASREASPRIDPSPPLAAPRRPSRPRDARAPDPLRWTELRPRLSERADGTLRADLRGSPDLAALARGLAARAAPEGGFTLTALDAQGYLRAAGIAVGDRLLAINGRPTGTLDELLAAYALARFGSTLSLQFVRGARSYLVRVEVLRDGP